MLLSCGDQKEVVDPNLLSSWIGQCLEDMEMAPWEQAKPLVKILDYDKRTQKFLLLFGEEQFTYRVVERHRLSDEVYICSYQIDVPKVCWQGKRTKC